MKHWNTLWLDAWGSHIPCPHFCTLMPWYWWLRRDCSGWGDTGVSKGKNHSISFFFLGFFHFPLSWQPYQICCHWNLRNIKINISMLDFHTKFAFMLIFYHFTNHTKRSICNCHINNMNWTSPVSYLKKSLLFAT